MTLSDLPLSPDVIALNPELAPANGRVRGRVGRERELLVINGRRVKSRLEERAWLEWVPAQHFERVWYEPFVLHLTGGNYTPDIVGKTRSGELWVIEVKGSWRAFASGRSSKRNLRQAAVEFGAIARFFSLMPAAGKERRRRGYPPDIAWDLKEFS